MCHPRKLERKYSGGSSTQHVRNTVGASEESSANSPQKFWSASQRVKTRVQNVPPQRVSTGEVAKGRNIAVGQSSRTLVDHMVR